MGYVAVSGGREAIENAEKFLHYERLAGGSDPLSFEQIRDQLYFLVDRVMGEGSLYAPDLAALAIKQSAGDTFEAAFMIRGYRTTLPRLAYSLPRSTADMRVIRRISSAFKDIPGGQILGPTPDYTLRLLDFDLVDGTSGEAAERIADFFNEMNYKSELPDTFPKMVEILRKDNLIVERFDTGKTETESYDVTRESPVFPASRSASMQTMARGETGGMLALAYSNMRGYGSAHPTIGELRVGYIPVMIRHPYRNETISVGEIKVTEAEIISSISLESGTPKFALGYGLCFGHNETKAISMAVLDRAMQVKRPKYPSEDQEFVLTHIDGIESMGFANHFKLPHYVTFQSSLDRLRRSQKNTGEKGKNNGKH